MSALDTCHLTNILPDCKGQDNFCAQGEFCYLTGAYRNELPHFECVKKLDVGMRCEDDAQCLYPDCVTMDWDDSGIEVPKCAAER